jgi:hypothetical protein
MSTMGGAFFCWSEYLKTLTGPSDSDQVWRCAKAGANRTESVDLSELNEERRTNNRRFKTQTGPSDAVRFLMILMGFGLTIKPENVYFRCVKNGKMHRKGLHPFIRSCKKQTIATLFGSKPTRINQESFKNLER